MVGDISNDPNNHENRGLVILIHQDWIWLVPGAAEECHLHSGKTCLNIFNKNDPQNANMFLLSFSYTAFIEPLFVHIMHKKGTA